MLLRANAHHGTLNMFSATGHSAVDLVHAHNYRIWNPQASSSTVQFHAPSLASRKLCNTRGRNCDWCWDGQKYACWRRRCRSPISTNWDQGEHLPAEFRFGFPAESACYVIVAAATFLHQGGNSRQGEIVVMTTDCQNPSSYNKYNKACNYTGKR